MILVFFIIDLIKRRIIVKDGYNSSKTGQIGYTVYSTIHLEISKIEIFP